MKFLSLALTGAMAIQPSLSFLLVPTIPQVEDSSAENALHNANEVLVNLACSKCPFPDIQNGDVDLGDGVDSLMAIKFSTSEGRLFLNDMQIYPKPDPLNPAILTGSLRRASDGVESPPLPFGYVIETFQTAPNDNRDKSVDGLITIRVIVVDLNGVPINMEPVEFRMIRTAGPEHDLLFAQVDIEPTMPGDRAPVGWRACNGSPTCYHKLLVARLRMLFASAKFRAAKLAGGVKGCMGKIHDKIDALWPHHHGHHHHGHHGHHHHDEDEDGQASFQGHDHHGHHGQHHHDEDEDAQASSQGMSDHPHHEMSGVAVALHKVAHIIVPGILGLLLGLFVALVPAFLAFVMVRGGYAVYRAVKCRTGHCCRRKRERREAGDDEENAPLVFDKDAEALEKRSELDEEEAPPGYEEGEALKEVHVDVREKE